MSEDPYGTEVQPFVHKPGTEPKLLGNARINQIVQASIAKDPEGVTDTVCGWFGKREG